MKPVEIVKNIYEVGVTDWNIRDFHGYSTHMGTSYNAYLILDEKTTLVDTVKGEFADQLLSHIAQVIDPKKIDLVISNHTEMDHSGGLPRIMHRIGEDKPIYCSKLGLKNLSRHFRQAWNYHAVGSGDTLDLGGRSLTFIETRMIHWPDSMFTYMPEEKILFSSDGFGQHYAGSEKFDDQIGDEIMQHAKKYFANILLLYAPNILKLLERVGKLGIDIAMICPDHGIIWRKDPGRIIRAYARWSEQKVEKKAVVVYDTMWRSTEKMAESIADGLIEKGIQTLPMHLRKWHRSDVMTEVVDAAAVIVGSPTLNNNLFPTVSDFLTYMHGLRPKNRIAAAFGSYGWSGEAVKQVERALDAMKMEVVEPAARVQYVPTEESLAECVDLGRRIGAKIHNMATS